MAVPSVRSDHHIPTVPLAGKGRRVLQRGFDLDISIGLCWNCYLPFETPSDIAVTIAQREKSCGTWSIGASVSTKPDAGNHAKPLRLHRKRFDGHVGFRSLLVPHLESYWASITYQAA